MSPSQQLQDLKEHITTLSVEDQVLVNMWCSELRDLLQDGDSNAFIAFALISCELTEAHQQVEASEPVAD
ncbi:MAG: hypothetical protein ACRCTL_01720 [Pseudomonas sp.]